MLEARDPLAIHFDPGADRQAMVRRFERGVSTLEQNLRAICQVQRGGGGIGRRAPCAGVDADRPRHRRLPVGRPRFGHHGPLGNGARLCGGPDRSLLREALDACRRARDDYVCPSACALHRRPRPSVPCTQARGNVPGLRTGLPPSTRRTWSRSGPTRRRPTRPRWGAGKLSIFVERVRAGTDTLSQVEGRLQRTLRRDRAILERGVRPARRRVSPRVASEARGGAERAARHRLRGGRPRIRRGRGSTPGATAPRLPSGFASPRTPPLRFADASDASGLEQRVVYPGNGALIRALASLDPLGMWSFSGILVDSAGARHDLRISARFERRGGAALRAPALPLVLPPPSKGVDGLRHVDITTTEELLRRFEPLPGGDELRLLDPPADASPQARHPRGRLRSAFSPLDTSGSHSHSQTLRRTHHGQRLNAEAHRAPARTARSHPLRRGGRRRDGEPRAPPRRRRRFRPLGRRTRPRALRPAADRRSRARRRRAVDGAHRPDREGRRRRQDIGQGRLAHRRPSSISALSTTSRLSGLRCRSRRRASSSRPGVCSRTCTARSSRARTSTASWGDILADEGKQSQLRAELGLAGADADPEDGA